MCGVRMSARQLIPLLSFHASCWYTITEVMVSNALWLRDIEFLKAPFALWAKIIAFAASHKKEQQAPALARVTGAQGSDVFTHAGVEPLSTITARVVAVNVRQLWARVESNRLGADVDDSAVDQITKHCIDRASEELAAALRQVGGDADDTEQDDGMSD
ncbi:unnamed protein product [Prorocentrum cordatum]|uniref:Uncharacterized protein n=1 Tax=Prorocentrum cordatum TaxID=2364126 RepID=A0ABN9QTF1_9DINO|nr:unnamed protein product [Polarella glacialis]